MLEEGLEEPRGGELEIKTGGDEFNGDRSAHKKTKTKKEQTRKRGDPKGPPAAVRSFIESLTRIPPGRVIGMLCCCGC